MNQIFGGLFAQNTPQVCQFRQDLHTIVVRKVDQCRRPLRCHVWHSLRVERPLIELHLFRGRGFRAAATTTLLLGAVLFGTLLILPLYYQVDRGESALDAGLLLAPQGIGAVLMLPFSGRLTDRIGGGRSAHERAAFLSVGLAL